MNRSQLQPEDEGFLREAIQLAEEHSQHRDGGPFGAIIVRERTIIGRGWNQVTSTNDPTAHAEVTAIRSACQSRRSFRLKGGVLYTSCEPCPMCLAAAYWARLDRVVFAATRDDAAAIGFDDSIFYQELARPIEQRQLHFSQLLHSEAVAMMQRWHALPNKVHY